MPVWGEHTRTFLDFVPLQSPLSQLSRTREANSDKFGHRNCVILRESAIRRFLANALNAQVAADLRQKRAKTRNG